MASKGQGADEREVQAARPSQAGFPAGDGRPMPPPSRPASLPLFGRARTQAAREAPLLPSAKAPSTRPAAASTPHAPPPRPPSSGPAVPPPPPAVPRGPTSVAEMEAPEALTAPQAPRLPAPAGASPQPPASPLPALPKLAPAEIRAASEAGAQGATVTCPDTSAPRKPPAWRVHLARFPARLGQCARTAQACLRDHAPAIAQKAPAALH